MSKNFVIAIASAPGGGKSTIARELYESFESSLILDFDNYQSFTSLSIEEVKKWFEAGADINEFKLPALEHDLACLKNNMPIERNGKTIEAQRFIFLETHFGKAHLATAQYIDILIWLDVPLDVSLARNIQSFCKMFLKDKQHHSQQINWLDQYLSHYLAEVRAMLDLQANAIKPQADIVIDNTLALSAGVSQCKRALLRLLEGENLKGLAQCKEEVTRYESV